MSTSKLPIDGSLDNRAQFEALGIVFHKKIDDMFVGVTLPYGWYVEVIADSRYSVLRDAQGRLRANIFHNYTLNNRPAFIRFCRRFRVGCKPIGDDWKTGKTEAQYEGVVKDGETVIFRTGPTSPKPPYNRDEPWDTAFLAFLSEQESRREEAKEWLSSKYPDWENGLAYWGSEVESRFENEQWIVASTREEHEPLK